MEALVRTLEVALDTRVLRATAVGGGDVAQSFRVELGDGRAVFAKTHPHAPPGFFSTEAAGLRWLAEPAAVRIPEVLSVSDGGGEQDIAHLALEWIDVGSPVVETEEDLGRSLARLHRARASCFGREDRRTTGSRGLPNEPCDTWAQFYGTQRLLPLSRLARESGALPEHAVFALVALADDKRLNDFGAGDEGPARLHGDLWAGNRLVDRQGDNWLIDPAAHGGHREFDLAMMRLFGGFGDASFSAYEEEHPLAAGWQERVPLHQLAPLAVHAIKFGGSYVAATEAAIARCA